MAGPGEVTATAGYRINVGQSQDSPSQLLMRAAMRRVRPPWCPRAVIDARCPRRPAWSRTRQSRPVVVPCRPSRSGPRRFGSAPGACARGPKPLRPPRFPHVTARRGDRHWYPRTSNRGSRDAPDRRPATPCPHRAASDGGGSSSSAVAGLIAGSRIDTRVGNDGRDNDSRDGHRGLLSAPGSGATNGNPARCWVAAYTRLVILANRFRYYATVVVDGRVELPHQSRPGPAVDRP
jgi:hypothetical protein